MSATLFPTALFPNALFPDALFPHGAGGVVEIPIPPFEGVPMPFGTYEELKTSILAWTHRKTDRGLIDSMPDFIRLAELNFNRLLWVRGIDNEVGLTATVGSRYLTLPADFSAPQELWFETIQPRRRLIYRDVSLQQYNSAPAWPRVWGVDRTQIALDRPAAEAYTFTLRYTAGFVLSAAAPTNWLLSTYPDVYLYGVLLQIIGFTGGTDDKRLAIWTQLYNNAVQQVQDKENRSHNRTNLESGVLSAFGGRLFNINQGD